MRQPYVLYDSKNHFVLDCMMADNEDEVWQVKLGWPHKDEIDAAKERGIKVIPATLMYKP